MKFNKVLMAGLMAFGAISTAQANSGTVTFEGQVLDTPCSVKPGAEDLNVPFGTIALDSLGLGGTSVGRDFTIELEGCDIGTLDTADITFTGDAGHSNTFATAGSANNIGIQISGNGVVIAPGDTDTRKLVAGNNKITYTAVVAADATTAVTPGNFTSTANYQITYQ